MDESSRIQSSRDGGTWTELEETRSFLYPVDLTAVTVTSLCFFSVSESVGALTRGCIACGDAVNAWKVMNSENR